MPAEFIYLASGSPRRRELLMQIGVAFQLLAVTVDESTVAGEEPEAYVSRLARSKAVAGAAVRPNLQPVLAADTAVRPNLRSGPVFVADAAGRADQLSAPVPVPVLAADMAVRLNLRSGPVFVADAAGRPDQLSAPVPVLAADTAVVLDGQILGKPADAGDAVRMLLALSGRTHAVLTAIALATASGVQARLSRSEVTFRAISAAEARLYVDSGEPCDKAGGYAIQGRAAVFVADLKGSYSGVMGLPLYETAVLLDAQGVPRWRTGGAV